MSHPGAPDLSFVLKKIFSHLFFCQSLTVQMWGLFCSWNKSHSSEITFYLNFTSYLGNNFCKYLSLLPYFNLSTVRHSSPLSGVYFAVWMMIMFSNLYLLSWLSLFVPYWEDNQEGLYLCIMNSLDSWRCKKWIQLIVLLLHRFLASGHGQ